MPLTRNQRKQQKTLAETANQEVGDDVHENAAEGSSLPGTVGLPKKRQRGRPKKVEGEDTKVKIKAAKRLQSKKLRPKMEVFETEGNRIYRQQQQSDSQCRIDSKRKSSISAMFRRKSVAKAKSIALNRLSIKHANDSDENNRSDTSSVEYLETTEKSCNRSNTQDINMSDVQVMKNARKFHQVIGKTGVRLEVEPISEEGMNEIKVAGVQLEKRLSMVLEVKETDEESSTASAAVLLPPERPEELDPNADGIIGELKVKNDTTSSSADNTFYTASEHASWQSKSQLEVSQYYDCEDNLPLPPLQVDVEPLPLDAIKEEDEEADLGLTDNDNSDEEVALPLLMPDGDRREADADEEEVQNEYEITTYEENQEEDYRQILRQHKTIPSWAGDKDELTHELYKQNPAIMKALEDSCPGIRGAIFPVMKKPYLKLFNIAKNYSANAFNASAIPK